MTEPKAKSISKFFKFFTPVLVLVLCCLHWFGIMPGGEVHDFIVVGLFIYGVGAGTIDANLIINNIKGTA